MKHSVSLCLPQYSLPPSLSPSLSISLPFTLSLSLSLSLSISLSLSLSLFLSLARYRLLSPPPPLSMSACLSLPFFSRSRSLSLSLRFRPLSLFFFFHAPSNSLPITGGRLMRLESACMSLLTNLKPVFIARSILLYVSTYCLCQSTYFLTFFLPFWMVRNSLSLSFCACYPG